MVVEKRLDLKLSDRLNIVYHLLRGEKVSPLIDDLDDRSVNGFQNFLWEKTVEFGIVSQKRFPYVPFLTCMSSENVVK